CVVEREHHRRHAGRERDFSVDQLGNRNRAVAPLIEELELPFQVSALDGPSSIRIADDVVLEDGNSAQLVRRSKWFDVMVLAWSRYAGECRNDNEREAKCRIHGRAGPWGREEYSLPSKKSTVRRVAWKPQTLAVVVKNERGPGPPVGAAWYEDRVPYEATVACVLRWHAWRARV